MHHRRIIVEVKTYGFQDVQFTINHDIGIELHRRGSNLHHTKTGQSQVTQNYFQTPPASKKGFDRMEG